MHAVTHTQMTYPDMRGCVIKNILIIQQKHMFKISIRNKQHSLVRLCTDLA